MTTPVSGTPWTASAYAAQATTPTDPTSAASTGSSSASGTSSDASLLNPQAFLQLLVAQLQYQDPTNPTDTSTFMNQTAMLSQVQTMDSMSSTLQSLSAASESQSATSMIGRQITWQDATGADQSGVATAAQLSSAGASLTVGDAVVPLSSVISVATAPNTTS